MMMPVGANDQPGTGTGTAEVARIPVAVFDSTGTIRIGRDADNDIVLPDFWVSKKHAEIRRVGSEYHLVDLNSSNGLHHNGRRVPRATLAAGDRFTVGRHEFLFDGMHLYQHDDQGPTSIIADDITVEVKGAVLLDDVSFALRHGTLLGIVGPSGCGKSTLLKAMTGIRPASRGKLLYDGKDLYEHYSELRYRIGMVPQDDVLHRQLTVRRALRFAASLRFASDVPRKARKDRVNEVLELLGLTNRSKQRIDTLSGGQRKRTSVALELLTEPSLLALDEPTSGLDPALDKEVMRELRLLADRGRTVVVVTHSVLHLDLCDYVLVMCLGGRMGYFGPPDELLKFFEAEDYADVFDKVTNDAERRAQIFRNSDAYRKYVGEVALELASKDFQPLPDDVLPTPRPPADPPMASAAVTIPESKEPPTGEMAALTPAVLAAAPAPAPVVRPRRPKSRVEAGLDRMAAIVFREPKKPAATKPVFRDSLPAPRPGPPKGVQEKSMTQQALHPVAPLRQFLTLCLRMIAVIFADRGYAAFLLGLPLALGVLSQAVPGSNGLGPDAAGYSLEAQRRLVVLIIGAAFMGVAVAIREIINESSIYKRERAIGLSATAYLASKVVIFLIIDAIQVVIFTEIALLGKPGPAEGLVLQNPKAELIIMTTLVAVTSTSLALLASALVKTTEQTTPILVVSVMFQLVLSGGLFAIEGQTVLELLAVIDPSRWGFAGVAATTNLVNFPFPDALWVHTPGNWWKAATVLIVQALLLLVGTRLALRRYEPGKG
jgi:ABC-type multidrug transport system ATPase subunit